MSQDLEKEFLYFVRKRNHQKRRRVTRRIGALTLMVGVALVGSYLLYKQQGFSLRFNDLSSTVKGLLLGLLGLMALASLLVYAIQRGTLKCSFNTWSFWQRFKRTCLRRIKRKYVLGLALLLAALIYQAHPSLINSPVTGLVTRLRYSPEPPTVSSLWPWEGYQTIHPVVANITPDVEQSIHSVAHYIAEQEPDPYLQVKALHDYVISRVTYDLDVLKTGVWPEQDAQTVFATHKAVCEGYAHLFQALGRAIGLEVVYVEGKIRRDLAPVDLIPETLRFLESNYDWTNHAWNAVKIEDNWQLVDTTWDGGNPDDVVTSYRADYLMPPPQVMITSHLPRPGNWQLLEPMASYRSFEKQPILTPDFFADELEIITPEEYQTAVHGTAFIEIQSPVNYAKEITAIFSKRQDSKFLLWDLPPGNPFTQAESPDLGVCQSQPTLPGRTQMSCQFSEAGDYQVLIFSLQPEEDASEPEFTPIGQLRFEIVEAEVSSNTG